MRGLCLRTVTVQWAARASLHTIVSSDVLPCLCNDVLPCLCNDQVGEEAASSAAHFSMYAQGELTLRLQLFLFRSCWDGP